MKAVLTSAPKATEVASAHKAIAVFDGVQGEGEGLRVQTWRTPSAKFKIERYLRYAHLIGDSLRPRQGVLDSRRRRRRRADCAPRVLDERRGVI